MNFLKTIKENKGWKAFRAVFLLPLIYTNCMSQPDFDTKVKSLINGNVPLIHTDELKNRLTKNKSLVLLDARSPEEYAVSHISNAQYVGYDDFSKNKVEGLDKNQPVVVYCSVGYRSEKIGEELQEMGFKNVYNLYGGIFDWKNKNNEVVNKTGATDSVHTYNRRWSKWLLNGTKVY